MDYETSEELNFFKRNSNVFLIGLAIAFTVPFFVTFGLIVHLLINFLDFNANIPEWVNSKNLFAWIFGVYLVGGICVLFGLSIQTVFKRVLDKYGDFFFSSKKSSEQFLFVCGSFFVGFAMMSLSIWITSAIFHFGTMNPNLSSWFNDSNILGKAFFLIFILGLLGSITDVLGKTPQRETLDFL